MQFSELKLPQPIVKTIQEQGYKAPTLIQEKSIPLIFEGKDIFAQSETGSGKTAAFALPILSMLSPGCGIQALVLTPTRELCIQVSEAFKGFAKYLPIRITPVFGGVGIGHQLQALKSADIVIATPGRLLDVMRRGCSLKSVKYLVLDEADRMLDMGFIDDVEKIIKQTAQPRQTLLFSATLSNEIRSLVHRHMTVPATLQTKSHVDPSLLTEKAYYVQPHDKFSLLVHCLRHETPGIALVFCATRHGCNKLTKNLRAQRIDAAAIHGGLSQCRRTQTMDILHQRGTGILVATDVASRGLHIDNISHVYNYDLPSGADDYTHRIGRTARAGEKGDAISFVTSQTSHDFQVIMKHLGRQIVSAPLPKFEKLILPQQQQEQHGFKKHSKRKRRNNIRSMPFWKRRKRKE